MLFSKLRDRIASFFLVNRLLRGLPSVYCWNLLSLTILSPCEYQVLSIIVFQEEFDIFPSNQTAHLCLKLL